MHRHGIDKFAPMLGSSIRMRMATSVVSLRVIVVQCLDMGIGARFCELRCAICNGVGQQTYALTFREPVHRILNLRSRT